MSNNKPKITFRLPESIASSTDLSRVYRELQSVEDFFHQSSLRTPGSQSSLPKTTKNLENLFETNGVSVLEKASRQNMLDVLGKLNDKAPVIHISFATEPTASFMEKVVGWSRKNINSYLLINVGLQPNVIVGCNVRTTNKVFDMSLRNRFESSKHILKERIEKMQKDVPKNV